MLVDANILLYAVNKASTHHSKAVAWLEEALNGPRRVALPWISLWAFVRISTNHRAVAHPLNHSEAMHFVDAWLRAPAAWVPHPTQGHNRVLRDLLENHDIRGALVTDAVLAALCLEHGLAIVSHDSDFARFSGVRWINPLL